MEIAKKITHVLNTHGKVELTGLGVLSMMTKHAQVDAENDRILPPKQELIFKLDRSVKADNEFLSLSYQLLKSLLEKGEATIEGVGKWTSSAGHVSFVSEPNVFGNSFYGLEEIVVPRVSTSKSDDEQEGNADNYKMNKSILWIFLVGIPVLGMIYLGFTNKELLIGKPSKLTTKKVTVAKPKKAVPVVADSLQLKISDSLKQDSIKKISTPKTR